MDRVVFNRANAHELDSLLIVTNIFFRNLQCLLLNDENPVSTWASLSILVVYEDVFQQF